MSWSITGSRFPNRIAVIGETGRFGKRCARRFRVEIGVMSASVFALVVAVEEYGEPKWHLPGATVDARLVSEQLIRLGVPPENIRVFLSPTKLAAAYQFPPALQVRAATFEVIKGVVEDELPT